MIRLRLTLTFLFLIGSVIPALAKNSLLPAHVTVLTRDDIRGTNAFDLADLLNTVPYLNVQKEGYRGSRAVVKIQGASQANRVLVVVDGRPLTHEFDGAVDLSQIPLSLVRRIEINRGGGSLAYGAESMAGTVHILTDRPDKTGLNTVLESNVGRDGVKNSAARLRARSFLGDMTYLGSAQKSSGYLFNEELDTTNHFGSISRSFKGKGYVGLEYFYQESEVGTPNGTLLPFGQWNGSREREPATSQRERDNELQNIKINGASPQFWGGILYGQYTQSTRDRKDFQVSTGPATLDQMSETGRTHVFFQRPGFEMGFENRRLSRETFPTPEIRAHQNSFYAQKKITKGRFVLMPSIRHDRHSHLRGVTSNRVTVLFAAASFLDLSGSVSQGLRIPTFGELFISTASGAFIRNLSPERSSSYNLGFTLRLSPHTHLTSNGYFSRVRELIQTSPLTGAIQNTAGQEENMGVETGLTSEWGEGTRYRHFQAEGFWTFNRSRQDLKNGLGFVPTALSPRHQVTARLTYRMFPKINIINEIRHQSEQFSLNNKAGVRVRGTTLWNARLRIRVLKALLYLDVENILQKLYADTTVTFVNDSGQTVTTLSPQANRTFFAGVSIEFQN